MKLTPFDIFEIIVLSFVGVNVISHNVKSDLWLRVIKCFINTVFLHNLHLIRTPILCCYKSRVVSYSWIYLWLACTVLFNFIWKNFGTCTIWYLPWLCTWLIFNFDRCDRQGVKFLRENYNFIVAHLFYGIAINVVWHGVVFVYNIYVCDRAFILELSGRVTKWVTRCCIFDTRLQTFGALAFHVSSLYRWKDVSSSNSTNSFPKKLGLNYGLKRQQMVAQLFIVKLLVGIETSALANIVSINITTLADTI